MVRVNKNITLKGGVRIKIAEIRKAQGISQERLAALSGVHRVTIARLETGKTVPKLPTLKRLAVALGVTLDELTEGA